MAKHPIKSDEPTVEEKIAEVKGRGTEEPQVPKVGDKMHYIPHLCHSHQWHPDKGFPWVFGWKTGRKATNSNAEEVIEMTQGEAYKKFTAMKKMDKARQKIEASRLVHLRPNCVWSGVVKKVTAEVGKIITVDLDIKDDTTGATLHYSDVPIDHEGKTPHSCHFPEADAQP